MAVNFPLLQTLTGMYFSLPISWHLRLSVEQIMFRVIHHDCIVIFPTLKFSLGSAALRRLHYQILEICLTDLIVPPIFNLLTLNIAGNRFGETGWNPVMSSESGEVNSTTGPPSWCKFQGVTCSTSSNYGSIERLSLAFLGMNGSFPNSIDNFLNLRTIDMAFNSITGTIPNSITLITSLTVLFIESNQIIGTIPTSIGTLTALDMISFGFNSFTGIIPNSITTLAKLNYLDLSRNFLTGTIPMDFSMLGAIDFLVLSYNYLTMGQLSILPISTFSSYTLDQSLFFDISNNCFAFDYRTDSVIYSASVTNCKPTSQPTSSKSKLICPLNLNDHKDFNPSSPFFPSCLNIITTNIRSEERRVGKECSS